MTTRRKKKSQILKKVSSLFNLDTLEEEEENTVATKLEETRARKIAEPFFSLASRPASCDKSASNSCAKARVGMKERNRGGNKGKKTET
ncbi:hypothetical protein DBV15_02371 [Temnothorax longispinosus]|uniref:Uncharacterized protein n=1 Tax=Temnothorax longispinosus TaxID=300112 RepID=A0A4S2JRU5_9HYME|nr:hypothetical protein DBV15_02371 [Temnothorax longispinosus]